MTGKYLIYGLVDPLTGHLRYIGKSTSGMFRPKQHFYPSNLKNNTHKNNWIKNLLFNEVKPQIVCIQVVMDINVLNKAEKFWIQYFNSLGCPLTNTTLGGDGLFGYKHTIQSKTKMSDKLKECWTRSSYRTKQKKARLGRKLSSTHKNNISKNNGRISGFKNKTHSMALKSKFAKPILDQFNNKYIGVRHAAKILGVSKSAIQNVLKKRNRNKTVKGRSLRYETT